MYGSPVGYLQRRNTLEEIEIRQSPWMSAVDCNAVDASLELHLGGGGSIQLVVLNGVTSKQLRSIAAACLDSAKKIETNNSKQFAC